MAKPASAKAAKVTRITETMQCMFNALRFQGNSTEFKSIHSMVASTKNKNLWTNADIILEPEIHGGLFKGVMPWKNWKKTPLAKLLIKYGNSHCVFGTNEGSATSTLEECYKYIQTRPDGEIGKGWWTTYIKIAEALYKNTKYRKGKSQKFHRGSKFVDMLEKTRYKKWNEASQNYFTEANKWQPADIWMVTDKGANEDFKTFCCVDGSKVAATQFEHGNQIMLEHFKNKDIIPISLKKIGSSPVRILEFNTGRKEEEHYDIKYTGATLNRAGDFWKSRDVYIYFKNGGENKIQFRNFASALSAWKGELSGTTARGGKIAPEVLERNLDGHGTAIRPMGVGIKGSYKLNGKTIKMDRLADQREVARRILGCKNELEESKRSSTALTNYKKKVSRLTYKEYVEEAYTKKERKSFITLAGQAFEDEEFFQDFYAYYKMLIESGNYDVTHDVHAGQGNKIMDPETFAVKLGEQPTSWIFSKYCGMVMLAILEKEKRKAKVNALVEQWALYAFALTPHGCPFIKVF